MIHGETRIVLKNPISGNILKDVKSENTFQSGVIAQALRNLGNANASILNNAAVRSAAPWRNVVGGILLFDDTITPGDNYLSPGTKMVGNGAVDVVNAGTPTELGSYDSNDSSATASAITMVYDFLKSQGNGTIKSVCLTSRMGGFIGYGNPSGVAAATPMLFESNQDITSLDPLNTTATNKRAVCGNYIYIFSLSGTDMIVKKIHVPVNEGSVFDSLEETITIDVSNMSHAYVVDNGFHIAGAAGGKFYITPENPAALTQNSVYKYWEYDPSNDTISEKSFTNPSATTLSAVNISFANGNIFVKESGADKIAVYDMSTGILKKEITNTTEAAWDSFNLRAGELPNGLSLVPFYDNPTYRLGIYDETNDTFFLTNGYKNDFSYYTNYTYDGDTNSMEWLQANAAFACNNPLYLATINNLQTPVTKNNSQTMTVTYTLSKS